MGKLHLWVSMDVEYLKKYIIVNKVKKVDLEIKKENNTRIQEY
jgi:hypothetical protein